MQDNNFVLLPYSGAGQGIILSRSQTSSIISRYGKGIEETRRLTDQHLYKVDPRSYADHTFAHLAESIKKYGILLENRMGSFTPRQILYSKIAMLYHDTGMANGVRMYKGHYFSGYARLFDEARANHPMMSGVECLLHREDINDACSDRFAAQEIALLCASHSKTNSGLKDFSYDTFCTFVDKFTEYVSKYAWDKMGTYIEFDANHFKEAAKDPEWLAEFKGMSELITLADAFTHASDTSDREYNQCGEKIGYEVWQIAEGGQEYRSWYYTDDFGARHYSGFNDSPMGYKFIAGEANVRYEEKFYSNTEKVYDFYAKNCGTEQGAVVLALSERIGELPRFNLNGEEVNVTVHADTNAEAINDLSEDALRKKLPGTNIDFKVI